MSWTSHGRVACTVHTAQAPSDDEWRNYLEFARGFHATEGLRVLVVSHGGGPNGRQRRELIDAMPGQRAPVAMLTNSALMRGVGTAVGWFNRSLQVFDLHGLAEAFDHLGLDPREREEVRLTIRGLEQELGLQVSQAN